VAETARRLFSEGHTQRPDDDPHALPPSSPSPHSRGAKRAAGIFGGDPFALAAQGGLSPPTAASPRPARPEGRTAPDEAVDLSAKESSGLFRWKAAAAKAKRNVESGQLTMEDVAKLRLKLRRVQKDRALSKIDRATAKLARRHERAGKKKAKQRRAEASRGGVGGEPRGADPFADAARGPAVQVQQTTATAPSATERRRDN